MNIKVYDNEKGLLSYDDNDRNIHVRIRTRSKTLKMYTCWIFMEPRGVIIDSWDMITIPTQIGIVVKMWYYDL